MHVPTRQSGRQSGFTLIELLVVILIVGILGTLVAMTYGGVQATNRNNQRRADINTLKGQLETYYAQHSSYPTVVELNTPSWRNANLKDLKIGTLTDPRWAKTNKSCSDGSNVLASTSPASNCYSYEVRATDGNACDNDKSTCAQYTLTATLEGGGQFTKSSLN